MLSHALGHDHEAKFGAYRSMIKAVKFPQTSVIKLILFRRHQGSILGIEQAVFIVHLVNKTCLTMGASQAFRKHVFWVDGISYLDWYGHQIGARGSCGCRVLNAADCGRASTVLRVPQIVAFAVLRCSHHVIVAPEVHPRKSISCF